MLITVCTCLFTADVHAGMGRHAKFLTKDQARLATKLNLIANPFGVMAYSLPNIAVAIFLNRILNFNSWRKWSLFGITILQSVVAGISCILLLTQCVPTRSLWDSTVKPARCIPANAIINFSYFVGGQSYVQGMLIPS